jgi:hypothetical protein
MKWVGNPLILKLYYVHFKVRTTEYNNGFIKKPSIAGESSARLIKIYLFSLYFIAIY